MINNSTNYEAQKHEWISEDPEGYQNFLDKQREKAIKSYSKGVEIKYCSICGSPMRYNSMSYHEGFHFDSCL